MKNFYQTPKQRKIAHQASQPLKPWVPREAWATKRKVGGVPLDVLEAKQSAAGSGSHWYPYWR